MKCAHGALPYDQTKTFHDKLSRRCEPPLSIAQELLVVYFPSGNSCSAARNDIILRKNVLGETQNTKLLNVLTHQLLDKLIHTYAIRFCFEVADDTVPEHGLGDRLNIFDVGRILSIQ